MSEPAGSNLAGFARSKLPLKAVHVVVLCANGSISFWDSMRASRRLTLMTIYFDNFEVTNLVGTSEQNDDNDHTPR